MAKAKKKAIKTAKKAVAGKSTSRKKSAKQADQKVAKKTRKKSAKKTAKRVVKKTPQKSSIRATKAKAKKSKGGSPEQSRDLDKIRSKLRTLLETPVSQDEVLKLLLSLEESERRALAPLCRKNFQEVRKTQWIENPPGSFSQNPLLPAAQLAVYCTGNFTEIKKLGRIGLRDTEVLLQVIEARRPDWASQFVEMLLGRSYYWNDWPLCRELVKGGLCPKPDNPRYYTGMITGLTGRWNREKVTAIERLRQDPGLLEDEVWRLFEYEGDADNTLANVDRFEKSNWAGALVTLSNEGKLSRARLLDAALDALQLGFNHYRARWFFTFFDLLEPTDQELEQRADKILDLLGSGTPNVAQWAFEKQEAMRERGLVKDVSQVIDASAPLLAARHKKTVMQVLKLYEHLAAISDDAQNQVCRTVVEALGHERADVQKAAFKILKEHGAAGDNELREAVRKYVEVAAPSMKKQLRAWLGEEGDGRTASGASQKAGGKGDQTPESKRPPKSWDLKKLDANFVKLFKLKPLIAALQQSPPPGTPIPAAEFDGTEFHRLDPASQLSPIVDVDELLEVLGRVIEDDSLVDEAERAVDGLARLHTDKPDDFEKRIAPLYKRAGKLLQRRCSAFVGQGVSGDVCGLICAWKRGEAVTVELVSNESGNERMVVRGLTEEPMNTWAMPHSPLAFMSNRLLDICQIMVTAEPRQLLSTPTHEGGWIAPRVLADRVNELHSPPPESDVILALLRLAPDDRAGALKRFKPKLKGEWVNALKHGLGAKGVRIGKSASLWAAAARCRAPYEDDPKVVKAFPKLGPGAGKAAHYVTRFHQEKTKYGPARNFEVVTTEPSPSKPPVSMPTQLLALNSDEETTISFHDIGTTAGSIRWLATMWPAERETFFAAGAICMGTNLDWWEAEWHNRCFLEPLLDPDTPILSMGEILLLCGLAAKEPGEHGLAVDIAIQAIADGRIGTDNLARMLTTGFTSGHFNLSRLAKRLEDIASSSETHAYIVLHATETALATVDGNALPRGTGDICELLLELGTQMNRGVESPACRTFLESLSGSNKAAKAARQLLAIETSFDPSNTIGSVVETRVQRIQIWTTRQ